MSANRSPQEEREFLKNYVQRIVDVRPNLVLVEKTVSRIAQDMLLEHGITLVINVKPVSAAAAVMPLLLDQLNLLNRHAGFPRCYLYHPIYIFTP